MSVGRRRFRIIKEIAEGGFGKVYLAEQISSDGFSRIVAVKLLHAKWSSHDEVVMRTRDEARLLGLIRHQHIVKVEDLTAIDGKCAIVMEYLEGVDLKWMLTFLKDRGEIFPRSALFEIILAVASALDAAYNGTPLQGGDPLKVIHRDIKPSNIFVTTNGAVKVLDFGTARANFAEREAKTQALAFGSQGYMAPERMLGEEDTPAADIFSLGITLYELLSLESFGRIPPRPNKFVAKVQERVASVPLTGTAEWQEQVRETLRLMLSYEPKERPSAAQLVEIMEILAQDAGDTALRKFCRTSLTDAKASLPELDTGDPLAGTIVDEDASGAFPLGGGNSGGQNRGTILPPSDAPSAAPSATGPVKALKSGAAPPAPAQPPSATGPMKRAPAPAAAPPVVSASPVAPSPEFGEPAPSGGGMGMIGVVVVVLLLLLVVGGVALVVTGGAAAFFMTGGGGTTVVEGQDPVPAPGPAPAPAPDPTPAPAPAPLDGGRVTSPDSRTGLILATSTLTYADAAGGQVTIKGPSGFEAEWDGKAPFVVDLGDGMYSTLITTADGKKLRGERFTVEAKKKSCAFTFDVGAEAWSGSCK